MNKTFCVLPWMHLCISTTNKVTPCCRFGNPKPDINLRMLKENGLGVMDHDDFIKIRSAMLEGEKVPGCHKCYIDEDAGFSTYRLESNDLYLNKQTREQFELGFKKLRYLEMSLDNICNLQCRMCDSFHSTKLIQRDKELNQLWKHYRIPESKILETDYSYLENEDLSELKDIKLLGGEPFISPNFIRFVDFLDRKTNLKNVMLMISSNGTHQLSLDIKERLLKFKNVIITVSLDSFDRCNDYQRYGSSYVDIWKNAMDYKQISDDVTVTFHCVVSIYTANKLDVTFDAFERSNSDFTFDFVRYQEMSLDFVPDDYSEWLRSKNGLNQKAKNAVLEVLSARNSDIAADKWETFLKVSKRLDKFYSISLGEYNPELYDFLKSNYGYDVIDDV